jgi:hypothetical protein
MTDYNTPANSGYRVLNSEEKALFEQVNELAVACVDVVNRIKSEDYTDKRWVAIGTTDLQTGLMALRRAVARPMGF